jgi:hypothetical protein
MDARDVVRLRLSIFSATAVPLFFSQVDRKRAAPQEDEQDKKKKVWWLPTYVCIEARTKMKGVLKQIGTRGKPLDRAGAGALELKAHRRLSRVGDSLSDELAVLDERAELLGDGDLDDVVVGVEAGQHDVHLVGLGGDDLSVEAL